ncbi:nitric-oxide synthase [Paenibacillaceae bacterium GAS479]|nr:nitric-oxide synthase [Paenibacillaceae bacterium GAS479]
MDSSSGRNLAAEAEAFLRQFGAECGKTVEWTDRRIAAVTEQIETDGIYSHSAEELAWGARAAWRNNSRCIGRLFWHTLDVVDARGAQTEADAAEALFRHLDMAWNGGRIRSIMTVFASSSADKPVHIWNHQLLRYAGYPSLDGTTPRRGDPASDAFTALCLQLGWKGQGGDFDLLPLVISIGDGEPLWFSIPERLAPEVKIEHPVYPSIGELGLRWYAVPVISDMALEIGGIVYAAPFNGWYMETEIGTRNFGDAARYNRIGPVADALGLDRSSNTTLWKDRALLELNQAVLHSFRQAGVSIVDHHTAADQFTRFQRQEADQGREVSARWSWIIPPISPSLTPVWHDSGMRELDLRPRLLQLDKPERLRALEPVMDTESERLRRLEPGSDAEPDSIKGKNSAGGCPVQGAAGATRPTCPFHS